MVTATLQFDSDMGDLFQKGCVVNFNMSETIALYMLFTIGGSKTWTCLQKKITILY